MEGRRKRRRGKRKGGKKERRGEGKGRKGERKESRGHGGGQKKGRVCVVLHVTSFISLIHSWKLICKILSVIIITLKCIRLSSQDP